MDPTNIHQLSSIPPVRPPVALPTDPQAARRQRVDMARRHAAEALSDGTRGIHIARGLATTIESIVVDEFNRALAVHPVPGAALLAVGGFGRAEFAPYSDVDLLLLVPEGVSAAALSTETFTPLWDAGLEPATALRTQAEALALAVEDHTAATALLDARHVAGDPAASKALLAQFWERLQGDRVEKFINDKVQELAERRQRFGGSVYLLEPNVKTGVGGLRDLAGGMWIAKARHRAKGLSGISHFGLLPRREIEALRAARDTLWRLRCQLHVFAKRKDERLTFAAQEQAAKSLGYKNVTGSLGVELLMRDYYLAAQTVEHATDTLIDRCTKEYGTRRGWRRATPINDSLEMFDGRVAFREGADPAASPALMVELFAIAERERAPVLSSSRDRVAQEIVRFGAALADCRPAMNAFLEYLQSPGATGAALRGMYETGVIGGLFPDFARLKARAQHDLYHVYTVDTHTLFALEKLLRLRAGVMAAEQPVFTRLCQDLARPLSLYVGLFFHDLGKHLGGDHSVKGEALVRAWAERAGIDDQTKEDAAFLVREHLKLSHVASRRDLSDPALIADVAAQMKTRERLDFLYLLTFADISSVGPDAWNDWRSRLLAELYEKCRQVLDSEGATPSLDHTEAAEAGARSLRTLVKHESVEDFIAVLPERYLATVSPTEARAHFEIWLHAQGRHLAGAPVSRPDLGDMGEVVFIAQDRPGILAEITGALAAHSVDILSAEIFSLKDGRVLDSFLVREPGNQPPSHDRLAAVLADLERVISGQENIPALLARRRGGRREALGPPVATKIRVDLAAARNATVVDVYTQDHIGLLHDLADAFHRAGASILLARIATEGNRATDGFYLQDFNGQKITDPEGLARIESALRQALKAE
jgi:[protein-PII] uridylyltransferase